MNIYILKATKKSVFTSLKTNQLNTIGYNVTVPD